MTDIEKIIKVSSNKTPADLVLKNAKLINVLSE